MTGAGLLAGWLADQVAGDPRRGHPVALFGAAAARLERRLWRDRRAAGVVFTAVCVGVPAAAAWAADRLLRTRTGSGRARRAGHPPARTRPAGTPGAGTRAARAGLLAAVTWSALGGRSLGREGRALADAVDAGDLARARARLPALAGRDPAGLGGGELCRAACESVAENTADAVVGPLLWGALAGPAGVVAYRCANTLDAMVGHRSARHARFGWAAARLDDLLTFVPARLTVLLAAACAPLAGGDGGRALGAARRDGGRHPSPNAGRVEAAFAGALGLRLGGTNRYAGRVEVRGPLGDGVPPDPAAVRRAVRLSALTAAAAAALATLTAWDGPLLPPRGTP
ncbi:MAG TPA: cobalamin biosynthesis protein [Actinomycetes bacterium]|nr:cobalamin biosynthesis protein [Actinomycetes bacterium]